MQAGQGELSCATWPRCLSSAPAPPLPLLPARSPNRWETWQGRRAQQGSSLKARERWQFYNSVLFMDELAMASLLHQGLCCVVVWLNPIPPVELHLRVILPAARAARVQSLAGLLPLDDKGVSQLQAWCNLLI